jgi:hypothetical protein
VSEQIVEGIRGYPTVDLIGILIFVRVAETIINVSVCGKSPGKASEEKNPTTKKMNPTANNSTVLCRVFILFPPLAFLFYWMLDFFIGPPFRNQLIQGR